MSDVRWEDLRDPDMSGHALVSCFQEIGVDRRMQGMQTAGRYGMVAGGWYGWCERFCCVCGIYCHGGEQYGHVSVIYCW